MEKVDILLSIYKPNEKYLIQQLESIDKQDYPNIELFVYDDCVREPYDTSKILNYVKRHKVTILPQQKENLGYIKAFENLVKNSTGEYVAFCDQDDIWFENKISESIRTLKEEGSLLVASDTQIIDENNKIIKVSNRENSNKNYHNWHSGDDIFKYTSIFCYSAGMCIVMDGNLAREMVPFPLSTGHDNWALISASAKGKVSFYELPLVQYRRHGKNVTGTLNGITTKKDYYNLRVVPNIKLTECIRERYPNKEGLDEVIGFTNARAKENVFGLLKHYYIAPDIARFDIVIKIVPNFLFPLFVNLVKKIA